MKTYEIHEEGNGKFATVEARTPASALNKAERQYKRRARDYNGYVGPVTWRAFELDAAPVPGVTSESKIVQVRR